MAFHDHFSRQAAAYTQFRPRYPRELFAFLASQVPRRERAWDCGTGNGQAAAALAEFFDNVIATDASPRQIAEAEPNPKVAYVVAAAESPPIEADSIDLVTVAQAVHWFDFPRFYAEVRRVGRAGSLLAVWAYGLASISAEVDRVVHYFYKDVLGSYWPPERKVIEQEYATIPFDFPEIEAPRFEMTAPWSLDDLLGYLSTWSSVQQYMQQNGDDPMPLVHDKLTQAWGQAARRRVEWTLYLRLGRIH